MGPPLHMALTVVQLLAVILAALALVPGAAHLAALPNKIGLPVDSYFTVQAIYRGWSCSEWSSWPPWAPP